jgi:hypothetical protein
MVRPEPCFRCGARASCRHRAVEDVQLAPISFKPRGTGNLNSPWGAKGNPAGKAKQRILDQLRDAFR